MDAVHLFAGGAGFDEEEDGGADLDFLADERDEVDAAGFDVGADCSGRERWNPKVGCVLVDDFAFNQCDLAFEGAACAGAAIEVALVLEDSFFGHEVECIKREHRCAMLGGMDVEGGDLAKRGCGRHAG